MTNYTDSRGLNAQATTQVTIQNPPPPPVDKALEDRLALHSVYFPTAQPTAKDPTGGLLPSQQQMLMAGVGLQGKTTKPSQMHI